MKILALLLIVMAGAMAGDPVADGYTKGRFNKKYYRLETTPPMPYRTAKQRCHDKNGFLARPLDTLDNMSIRDYFDNLNHGTLAAYIGANDRDSEGNWFFASLTNDNFINARQYQGWNFVHGPGEPNGQRQENCVTFVKNKDNSWWNDIPCSYAFAYLCQHNDEDN